MSVSHILTHGTVTQKPQYFRLRGLSSILQEIILSQH